MQPLHTNMYGGLESSMQCSNKHKQAKTQEHEEKQHTSLTNEELNK